MSKQRKRLYVAAEKGDLSEVQVWSYHIHPVPLLLELCCSTPSREDCECMVIADLAFIAVPCAWCTVTTYGDTLDNQ